MDYNKEWKDYLGNEIKIGDTIVYPTRAGSWMEMNTAVVYELFMDDTYRGPQYKLKATRVPNEWSPKAAKVTISCLGRVVVIR